MRRLEGSENGSRDYSRAILEEQDFDGWLKGTVGKEALLPAPENVLREWLVPKRVNKAPPASLARFIHPAYDAAYVALYENAS